MMEKEHPRRDLSFTCSRRTFFRALFQELFVVHGTVKGGQGGRLSELGSLPDDQLAHLTPVVSEDCEIVVDHGRVCARYKAKEVAPVQLFSTDEAGKLMAFNMFNGQHTLGEISDRLAEEMAWDLPTAFAHIRDLFLTLVERGACHPKHPPAPNT